MCGIIGYTGRSQALPVLIQGIRLLSYRGYDSAGVSVWRDGELRVRKDKGRIEELAPRWDPEELAGTTGVGHTRWATHGAPSQPNAHPQAGGAGEVALVHNGIVENDLALREELEAEGVRFSSETDTEVLAHLYARAFRGDPVAAARELLRRGRGAFAVAVQHRSLPDTLVAVRRGSPLLVGLGVRENLVASDLRALVGRADRVLVLGEDEIAVVRPESVEVYDAAGRALEPTARPMAGIEQDLGKGGHAHYMLKEMHEQPERLYELLAGRLDLARGRLRLDDLPLSDREWRGLSRVDLVGCGTAYHACWYGARFLEVAAGMPARAVMAHEYERGSVPLGPDVLVVAVSQSGETMDTKLAVEAARAGQARTLGVLNQRESVIGRLVEGVFDMHAGLEVGVASTKAYTSMLAALLILGLRACGARQPDAGRMTELADALRALPDHVRTALARGAEAQAVARDIHRASTMLYLGRGLDAPTALEGALKMKEISYIHAEGYPAGEMKHGPIALVSKEVPVVALATQGPWRDRMLANVREVRARDGEVILVANDGDAEAGRLADFVLRVPATHPWVAPLLNVVPLQLLAYETAKRRGCDIDQPRNLAKTVTVQ